MKSKFPILLKKSIHPPLSTCGITYIMQDSMIFTHEAIYGMKGNQNSKENIMVVKLDMEKEYDRINWSFIEMVLLRMGFNNRWVSLIIKCVIIVSYAVVINWEKKNYFKPSRGLR